MPQDDDLIPFSLLREAKALDLGSAFSDVRPSLSALASSFIRARNAAAHKKAQQEARDEKHRSNEQKAKTEADQQSADTTLFVQVIHQIDQRIAELEGDMARRYKQLQDKYGENALDGIVASFLNEEEQAGLQTDDDKNLALANKFLDQDGDIKPEYQNLLDAQYIRDWYEHRQLNGLSVKLHNGETLDADDHATLQKAGVSSKQAMYLNSEQSNAKQILNEKIDDDRAIQAASKTDTNFNF